MKKAVKFYLAGALTTLLISATVIWANPGGVLREVFYDVNVTINGVPWNPPEDMTPFISGGRTFLPARGIAEMLGVPVDWDETTRTVYVGNIPQLETSQDTRTFTLSNAITTNLLQSPGGRRHVVRVEVGVGINNIDTDEADEFIQTLMEHEIVIVHTVTEILRRTTIEQLEAVGGSEALAEDILAALQDAFDSRMIVRVYLGNLFTA